MAIAMKFGPQGGEVLLQEFGKSQARGQRALPTNARSYRGLHRGGQETHSIVLSHDGLLGPQWPSTRPQ